MNLRLILVGILSALYILGANWWYGNKIEGICCGPGTEAAAATAATTEGEGAAADATAKVDYPLMFNWSKSDATAGTGWDAFQSKLTENMTEDNILQITGHYFKDEPVPDGYENMGFARAAQIREMLKDVVPAERIEINGKLVADTEGMKDHPFEAADFNWKEPMKADETKIVEAAEDELEDRIVIFYPSGSAVKDKNPTVDEYLSKLAERMKKTGETVSITGHTDDDGDDNSNIKLGNQRAKSVRDILVRNGVDNSKITTASRGESQPIATNTTAEGKQKNRRAVLILNKKDN